MRKLLWITVLLWLSASFSACQKKNIYNILQKNQLSNLIIPHKIDTREALHRVLQQGFKGWELDITITRNPSVVFEVKHDAADTADFTLETYLDTIKSYHINKLWFDFKNVNCDNFAAFFAHLQKLDSLFHLKNRVIIETMSWCDEIEKLRDAGWISCYYMPYYSMKEALESPSKTNPDSLAQRIAAQVKRQKVKSVSFDVCCYPFVKEHLESLLPGDVTFQCWDLSLKLSDKNLIKNYRAKPYAADSRIKTLLIPLE